MMKGSKIGNLHFISGSTVTDDAAVSTSGDSDSLSTHLWHMHLGHMTKRGLEVLGKQGMLGGTKMTKLDFCEPCVFGKQCKVKFSTAIQRTKGTLDYIHSDVWDPLKVVSKGSRYFVTFIDDFSCKVWVYFLKTKDEVFETFKKWKAMVEKQTEKKIKRLRTGNGGVYSYQPFLKFCEDEGIVRHFFVKELHNKTKLQRE